MIIGDLVNSLRRSWQVAAQAATGGPELGGFIAARLDELEATGTLDKPALMSLLDEVAEQLRQAGHGEAEPELSRRLLRAVFEFLLGVDARVQLDQLQAVSSDAPSPSPDIALEAAPRPVAAVDLAEQAGHAAAAEVEVLLRKGRHAEVAALLGRLAEDGGVPELAAIALDAGNRCRAAGEARAAGDCYLAAWTVNRLDETALWRLAELAMEAHDHELAVSYLDRLAAVLQWRGDVRGMTRVFRKMSILAPDREDIREQLRRMHSTGQSG